MTRYRNALALRFQDRDAKDEAYPELEEVWYEGWSRDKFTTIQMHNDLTLVTGATFNKFLLEQLPQKILVFMHRVDLTGKTDKEIITIIRNARRMAEKWDAARKNLGLKVSLESNQISEKKYGFQEM